MKNEIYKYLGVESYRIGHAEKLLSALGAFLGIAAVFYSSFYFLQDASSFLIVASMGASAVLLFAVPHGRLSQPWSLIGGHFVSALIGVSCAKFIPDIFIAAPLAVGLSVGVMYYLHCIHPPGGATALTAVVGGNAIHDLGYQFVLTPVLINVFAILITAIVFNYFPPWRRYPAYLAHTSTRKNKDKTSNNYDAISHEDFVFALSEFESFIDVSENDLIKIYDLVTHKHKSASIQHHSLQHGHFYSNGEHGNLWSVRQIVDWAEIEDWPADTNTGEATSTRIDESAGEKKLIYKVVAGDKRRTSGVSTKNEFARWAKHEVIRDENNWRRIDENAK